MLNSLHLLLFWEAHKKRKQQATGLVTCQQQNVYYFDTSVEEKTLIDYGYQCAAERKI